MDTLQKELIEVTEKLERTILLRKLMQEAINTGNTDIMQFVNKFDKENA